MNENLNLIEILKDCPKGTKLYSTIYGDVELEKVYLKDDEYPIEIKIGEGSDMTYVANDGRLLGDFPGECTLFPSKDQRDWSKFKLKKPKFKVGDKIVNIPRKYMGALGTQGIISKITDDKYIFTNDSYIFISNQDSWELVHDKKPRFDPKTFQPFDKVLVRNCDADKWKCAHFSYMEPSFMGTIYVTSMLFRDRIHYNDNCIPYNDDTKHLVGTTDEAPEFYRYWED